MSHGEEFALKTNFDCLQFKAVGYSDCNRQTLTGKTDMQGKER